MRLSVRSTLAAHEAQVMPPMASSIRSLPARRAAVAAGLRVEVTPSQYPPGVTRQDALVRLPAAPVGRRLARVYRTISQLLLDAADRDPDGAWLRTDDGVWSFAEAAGWVGASMQRLREAGLVRGDLVVLTARSTPGYLISWLAVCAMGAIAVPTNPRGTWGELSGLLRQTRPRLVVTDGGLRELVAESGVASIPGLDVLHVNDVVTDERGVIAEPGGFTPDAQPDDVAVLIPTSGTTGRSKLVMQTHRAYTLAGEGFPYWIGLTPQDRLMTSLPLFHINAPAYSVCGSLAVGAGLVLLPRFSASGFLDDARRHGATQFNAIGAMMELLMRQPQRPDDADNPVRLCYTGPAPAKPRHLEIERRFGWRVTSGYALSESPYGLVWQGEERPYGTLGRPRQHPELGEINFARVVDEQMVDVPAGGTGELLLRNPAVTPGYWEMPEETKAAITEDGWLHTGDLATGNPDGTYTFVARRKEVIRRRGENLSPLEVEQALEAHPAVLEAAVIGVPSELSEEDVKAFVVPTGGGGLDFDELRDWVSGRLADFKVPTLWEQLDSLPRTPTDRVAKHVLRTRR